MLCVIPMLHAARRSRAPPRDSKVMSTLGRYVSARGPDPRRFIRGLLRLVPFVILLVYCRRLAGPSRTVTSPSVRAPVVRSAVRRRCDRVPPPAVGFGVIVVPRLRSEKGQPMRKKGDRDSFLTSEENSPVPARRPARRRGRDRAPPHDAAAPDARPDVVRDVPVLGL